MTDKSRRLFEPPPKPRASLHDEEIAVKVVEHLIGMAVDRWHFDDDQFSEDDRIVLAEALMATGADRWRKVLNWICRNRPRSDWKWEDKGTLLEYGLAEACEAVLPIHQRRGKYG